MPGFSPLIFSDEVGYIKKEIAYHGNVFNTAARIWSVCNDFNKDLLVSEHIIRLFNNNDTIQFESHTVAQIPRICARFGSESLSKDFHVITKGLGEKEITKTISVIHPRILLPGVRGRS